MKSQPLAPLRVFAAVALHATFALHAGAARAGEDAAAPPASATAAPTASVIAAPGAHAFEGIWMFDARRSDDPRKVMESSRGGAGRRPEGGMGRGGMGEGGMRHGGRGRGGMGEGGSEGMGRGGPPDDDAGGAGSGSGASTSRGGGDPRRAMQRVFDPPKKMVVYVDHDRFQVEDDEGAPRVYTIADSLAAAGVNALETEATVRTRGRALEAKQPLGRRGALLETYELSEDGRTLTIRAQRQGGPEGAPNPVFTRVYTKYEGE